MISLLSIIYSSCEHLKSYLDLWKPQIAAAKSRSKEFVVGMLNYALGLSNTAQKEQANTVQYHVLGSRM